MAFTWQSLLAPFRASSNPNPMVSFVLLESEWRPLPDEVLLGHAYEAYEAATRKGGIKLLENRSAESRVLRVENFFFAFHQAQQCYTGPPSGSPEAIRQAWADHNCWSSLDWVAPDLADKDKPGARKALLPLVSFLWNSNTTALFFPDRGLTIPNMGGFPESIRWAIRNGIPVQELFPPVPTTKVE